MESKTKKVEGVKYYSLAPILSKDAQYNIIFGERSNGKTYAILDHILEDFCKHGNQGALVRRWKEDFRGKRGQQMFDALVTDGRVSQLTNGKYSTVYSYSGKWYLANPDARTGKMVSAPEPFCFGFALSDVEHDKSTSYPKVKTIFFDEFLTRQYYLPDEFVTFMNVVSTIVRQRSDVRIFMAGNTVNQYCPYFTEMGLTHIKEMDKGAIEVYKYGESKLRVAVEYADSISKKGKPSDIYFAFDNPKLTMITGGSWEMAMYPHLPYKYLPQNVLFTYFMKFNDELLQCEIIHIKNSLFTYIHRKTTPIQNEDKDIIYSLEYDPRPNHIRNMRHCSLPFNKKIGQFFADNQVFYQDNEVGEIVRNYLVQCSHDAIV
nr:MAG TPA: Terminase [Bacteriophage sp.]